MCIWSNLYVICLAYQTLITISIILCTYSKAVQTYRSDRPQDKINFMKQKYLVLLESYITEGLPGKDRGHYEQVNTSLGKQISVVNLNKDMNSHSAALTTYGSQKLDKWLETYRI